MDVFDLVAKISLDDSEYRKGLGRAQQSTSTFGEVFKANIASGLVDKAFSGIVEGAKKGAGALISLTKQAVAGYGEAEQLVGGVEKLYGDSAKIIEGYAADAYRTSGMSANQYMETATQFSASLISSLGGDTKKAAEQTDVAMRAISDNVNVFGSNMEDVTNAFKGFSKQNYTMLDNLKLGYGGTKQEMERLIKDANEYAASIGQASDLSIDSFSDIVTAVELVQEKQNIAGTTAKEAASTLQGSITMLKTSWENLVSGISDPNANIGTLINNVVSSAETAIGNLLPVIERAINGIGTIITDLAPVIAEKLPALIEKIAPPILTAIGALFGSIVQALPGLLQTISDAIPGLIKIITDALPEILPSLVQAIGILIDGIATALPELIDQILDVLPELMKSIWDGLGKAFDNASPAGKVVMAGILAKTLGGGLVDAMDKMSPFAKLAQKGFGKVIDLILPSSHASQGGDALSGMFENATKAAGPLEKILPKISGAFSSLGSTITTSVLPAIGGLLTNPVTWVIAGIAAAIVGVIEVIKHWDEISKALEQTWEAIKEFFAPLGDFFGEVFGKIGEFFAAIPEKLGELMSNIGDFLASLPEKILEFIENIPYYIGYALGLIVKGLVEVGTAIVEWITTDVPAFIGQVVTFVQELPGKIWGILVEVVTKIGEWGANLINWVATNIPIVIGNIVNFFAELPGNIWNWLVSVITNIANWGKMMINYAIVTGQQFLSNVISFFAQLPGNIWNWLVNTISNVGQFVRDMGSKALEAGRSFFNNIVNTLTGLPGEMLNIGKNIVKGIWEGIKSMFEWVKGKIKGFADGIAKGFKDALGIHSPSKVFAGFGKFSVLGYEKGWEDNVDSVIDDMQASLDASSIGAHLTANMSALPGASGSSTGTTLNAAPITINVYGAEGQNVQELADIVAERINQAVERERLVFA